MGKKKFAVSDDEISERFALVDATIDQEYDMEGVVDFLASTALYLNDILPDGRDKALALTRLEEAEMWAMSAILRGEYPND